MLIITLQRHLTYSEVKEITCKKKPATICVEPYSIVLTYLYCIFLGLFAAPGTPAALLICVTECSVAIAALPITNQLVSSLGQHPFCINFHLNPD